MNDRFTSVYYPFTIDSGKGSLAEERNYSAHVEQMIKQVLLTSPGERINRPDFGCGLRQMVFAPNSDASANLTQITILQALEEWLSTIIDVHDVKVKAINEILEVQIIYTIRARQERKYLNLEVVL